MLMITIYAKLIKNFKKTKNKLHYAGIFHIFAAILVFMPTFEKQDNRIFAYHLKLL